MKKTLLSIILSTAFVLSSYSQKVMGIDINTTSKKFEMAMSKKGYKPSEKVSGNAIYNVIYAGYKGTNVKVLFDETNDSITLVKINFDNRPIKERVDIFNNLEKQFKAKYPEGESFRMDADAINSHSRWWRADGVSMRLDEVNGDLGIDYIPNYRANPNRKIKPSDDI